jgi:hypothetical protein
VVDPFTKSVLVNSEDGKLYRWDLTTNTLSQTIVESQGIGEAYTPTAMGPDGTVYAINYSILNAVGRAPQISINNVSSGDGTSGTTSFTFTVSLDYSSTQTITVQYATADGTATLADRDYQATSGTLTFAPGVTSQTITVLVNSDNIYENNETFTVNLSAPSNATFATGTGTGTILNDDPAPSLSINNVTLGDGTSGTTPFTFTVTLTGATELTTTVNYLTADGTATRADGDYQAAGGTLTFIPGGVTSQTITVQVNSDNRYENSETFTVNLSAPTNATIANATGTGTILNDDPAPTLAINNVTQNEPTSGTTNFVFTVTLTGATELPAMVNYATADGTATVADGDYQSASGTLTFAPGVTSQTITVAVNSDTATPSNETFFVNLSAPTNATIANGQGTGTIVNQAPPHIDYMSYLVLPGGRLLLRAVNVTDTDDAVVSVSFYYETNGQMGLQTGPGGDTLLYTATNGNWTANVIYRAGIYYAQALDASGLLSNVVQLVIGSKVPAPPSPSGPFGLTASATALPAASSYPATAQTASTNSVWSNESSGLPWFSARTSRSNPQFLHSRFQSTSTDSETSGLWDIINPLEGLIL